MVNPNELIMVFIYCRYDDEEEVEDEDASVDEEHPDDPEFIPSEESGNEGDDVEGGSIDSLRKVSDESIMFLRHDYSMFLEELVNEQIAVCIEDMFGGIVREVMDELTPQPVISQQPPESPVQVRNLLSFVT